MTRKRAVDKKDSPEINGLTIKVQLSGKNQLSGENFQSEKKKEKLWKEKPASPKSCLERKISVYLTDDHKKSIIRRLLSMKKYIQSMSFAWVFTACFSKLIFYNMIPRRKLI